VFATATWRVRRREAGNQLTWCQKEGVRRAVISHCGKEIVEGDRDTLAAQLAAMARERGVHATIAYDGLSLVLR
jgi:hypothetical protein